jgi:hypothetical protein
VDPEVIDDVVAGYEDAQLMALKAGLLACGLIALASLAVTRNLPAQVPSSRDEPAAA